jgi:hypothetical protein
VQVISDSIDKAALRESSLRRSPLYTELVRQAAFCQSKCDRFFGRVDSLAAIRAYLQLPSTGELTPLVVHGPSGCGKTALMAMAARACSLEHSSLANETHSAALGPVLIVRFLGTTQLSSSVRRLLPSMCTQIALALGSLTPDGPAMHPSMGPNTVGVGVVDMQALTEELLSHLSLATAEQPILVMLDALDQLSVAHAAHHLAWLPKRLPPHVHVVVSALSQHGSETPRCYGALSKALMALPERFVSLAPLDSATCHEILVSALAANNRTLQPQQMEIVSHSFAQCSLPLYVRMVLDRCVQWRSFTPLADIQLPGAIRPMIEGLFAKLELEHGQLFVERSLGYLTASRWGLSLHELEDVVSCDDDVLNAVFEWWLPPIRRLPPLLLARMRASLGPYLV